MSLYSLYTLTGASTVLRKLVGPQSQAAGGWTSGTVGDSQAQGAAVGFGQLQGAKGAAVGVGQLQGAAVGVGQLQGAVGAAVVVGQLQGAVVGAAVVVLVGQLQGFPLGVRPGAAAGGVAAGTGGAVMGGAVEATSVVGSIHGVGMTTTGSPTACANLRGRSSASVPRAEVDKPRSESECMSVMLASSSDETAGNVRTPGNVIPILTHCPF
jgi:hypothetical protein